MKISLNTYQQMFFLYFTTLPWIDCIAFLLYDEIKLNKTRSFLRKSTRNETPLYQQRIGKRLSSYRECVPVIQIIDEK